MLNEDVDKMSIRIPDKWGDLPLHTAASRHQTEVVKLLVESDITKKTTLYTKADNGSLPIHAGECFYSFLMKWYLCNLIMLHIIFSSALYHFSSAVRYGAPASVIMLLLESNESRSTLLETDAYGQTPLHASCRRGGIPEVIDLLLKFDKDKTTISATDNVGRLPIHLALLHTFENQIEVVKLLLESMICGLMNRKGLELWKDDIQSLLNNMRVHERDFTTRDKLDMICDTVVEFRERVFVLELAVWRASCLQFDTSFTSIQEAMDHEASTTDAAFDINTYKADRRIRSGADIIIRDVIPFLEHEAVEEALQKLRDY